MLYEHEKQRMQSLGVLYLFLPMTVWCFRWDPQIFLLTLDNEGVEVRGGPTIMTINSFIFFRNQDSEDVMYLMCPDKLDAA